MDDNTYNLDPKKSRERAERVFKEQLEVIAERLSIHPRHTELVRDITHLVLASEEIPKLEKRIEKSYLQGFDAFSDYPPSLLEDEISWYRSMDFICQPPATIVIGSVGESRDDNIYTAGMRAEIGHTLYFTLMSFRKHVVFGGKNVEDEFDKTVSEFYDFICWKCTEPTLNKEYIRTLNVVQNYCELSKKTSDINEMAKIAAPQLAPCFFPDYPEDDAAMLESLEGVLKSQFGEYSKTFGRHHVFAIGTVLAPLLDAVAERTGLPPEECAPVLVEAGAKAMYDPRVDFSSTEAFVETMKARLPKYFPRTLREKLLKWL